ncbi:meiosis 1 arrest protein isoform X1 [Salmo trutta]|uniref:meiosis 1 arrest protein isoform X1 n=1 Tax=Salmo trutta TaxID=8032 RepID=UPI0011317ABF|nr:meiosis 1 arrest protein isoform X1 [Salmo trutta]XP_029610386.1 meiosis 1 arrest protein isoform X1 [Salmo trutta]XP_029610387.1 meiosis 1 arrest protein isoform X1 [Salmo trutta]XP_029610388.1 meiosis 1 arrest protein isoform X1 [Salmo trutta]
MDARNRSGPPSSSFQVCRPSSFSRQPPRVLIVDASPPWWSETGTTLCEALDNFLTLACSLDGPCRLPLLSLYTLSRQHECLLPFVQVRGNLARLRSCVEELRSIPGEGCVRAPRGELLKQAVLDSLQQFKQYTRHTTTPNQANNNGSVEVTVVTSQPGRGVVRQLEAGLKDTDLVSLRRLLVVHVSTAGRGETDCWGQDTPSPETAEETEASLMLGTEIDLQHVENSVVAMETALKAWLHDQGGNKEQLHLLLPPGLQGGTTTPSHGQRASPVCVKCDMQERLLSPALLPLTPDLGVKTESTKDFLVSGKGLANQSPPPQRLRVIKTLHADGVCESVLYGLPLIIRPTTCWQMDWDEMERNHHLFHALCHTLRVRDWFLLVRSEPIGSSSIGSGVCCHYLLQPSASLSLLLKPVANRELLLPCQLPVSNQDPPPDALTTIQSCVGQLEEESLFNPLSLRSNLYQHLRSRGLLSPPSYPYRSQQTPRRDQPRPAVGLSTTPARQPRQQQQQGRQFQGGNSRVRATVAPLPSAPPPSKMSRPTLTMTPDPRATATPLCSHDDDLLMML